LPPLALALIRDPKGSLVMAQGEDINHIKIGREVYLHQAAGIVYFTVKNQLQLVREAMGRLLHRRARQAKLPQSLEAQR